MTPDSELEKKLRIMPKVEIHVHLEGAMTPQTIWEMAKRNRVKLPVGSLTEWEKYLRIRLPHNGG